MNWETRTPEHHDLMEGDAVVGRVRTSATHDARWVAYIADQGSFRGIGQGTLREAQHIVALEAGRRLRARLLRDSASHFGLGIAQAPQGEIAPPRATGLRLIRGGAGEGQGE